MKILRQFALFATFAAAATAVASPAHAESLNLDLGGRVGTGHAVAPSFASGTTVLQGGWSDTVSSVPSTGTAVIAVDASATLNFAAGFVDSLSFYYSSLVDALDVVTVFAGLDRTGPVLGELSLSENAHLNGCTATPFCNWQRIELSFEGVGKSIGFGGSAGNVAFDKFVITPVPEASTYALMGLGLAGVAFAARRRRV